MTPVAYIWDRTEGETVVFQGSYRMPIRWPLPSSSGAPQKERKKGGPDTKGWFWNLHEGESRLKTTCSLSILLTLLSAMVKGKTHIHLSLCWEILLLTNPVKVGEFRRDLLSRWKSSTIKSSGLRLSIIHAAKDRRRSVGAFFSRGVEVDLMYIFVSSMNMTAQMGTCKHPQS